MKRWARLEVRLVALSLVTLAAVGARGQAQEPKTVRIDTLGVMDTLYHLSGGGGNSLAFIDEINGGVVLVDTKRPGWGQPVRDALDGVTDLPVTTIINTHAHPDHAGSNGEFGTAVEIVAHENTKANTARMDLYSGTNAASLPTKTFADRLSLLEGIDRIDLYHFGPAHTDGDVIVVFPEKGVAYMGGLFPYVDGFARTKSTNACAAWETCRFAQTPTRVLGRRSPWPERTVCRYTMRCTWSWPSGWMRPWRRWTRRWPALPMPLALCPTGTSWRTTPETE